MLTPQEWIDNGTVVFEDNIITNAGEGKAPIEGAFRTIVLKAGIPLEDAIKMSSLTPARIMHVDDRKGSLEVGKDADIVIYNQDLFVEKVF